jgi:hypothetical protein
MDWRDVSRRDAALLVVLLAVVAGPVAGAASTMLTDPVETSGEIPLAAPSGATVYVQDAGAMELSNPFPAADTVQVHSEGVNASVSGPGGSLTLEAAKNGQRTVTNISAGDETLLVDWQDWGADIEVSGGITSATVTTTDFTDSASDGSADLTVSTNGSGELTLRGLTSDQTYALADSNGDALSLATSDGAGAATFTLGSQSDTDLYLQRTDANAPVITDLRPVGRINSIPDTMFANVSDEDFAAGDTVNVTATITRADGETRTLDTAQISSNQSLAFNITEADKSFIGTGRNTIRAIATDEYGNRNSLSKPFDVPSKLYIRNVSAPGTLIDNTTANITVYDQNDQGTVLTRDVSDGAVNMSGLDVTTEFLVEVTAPGYRTSTVRLPSIYQQQDIYLLPDNTTAVETRFELEDTTGAFPSGSVLYIERPIERNNTTAFRTMHSDTFGVEGVTVDLEEGVRYQLRIRAPDGDTASLGSYTARVSETVTLRPDSPGVTLGEDRDSVAFDASLQNNNVVVEYRDPTGTTEELTVTIHERGDPDNLLRATQTYYDLGNLSLSEPLGDTNQTEYAVILNGERGGDQFQARLTVGYTKNTVPMDLDRKWRLAIAVPLLLISGGAFSRLNVGVGAVVLSIEGGVLWYLGWLDGVTTGAMVAIALGSSVLYTLIQSR